MEYLPKIDVPHIVAIPQGNNQQRDGQSHILGHNGAPCNARNPHLEAKYKPQRCGNVDDVVHNRHHHGGCGVLHARQPAVQRKDADGRRSSPDAGIEILRRQSHHIRRATLHNLHRQPANRAVENQQNKGNGQSNKERTTQNGRTLALVVRTIGLGRQTTGAHPQKGKVPVDEVENGSADRFMVDVLSGNTGASEQDTRTVLSIAERKVRLTENNLILASNVVYTYSNRFNIKDQDFFTFRTKVEAAGNILNAIAKSSSKTNENGKHTVLDVAYSQYIKGEVDFIKYFDLGNKNVLAVRAFGGIAIPYGNSDNIPFSRSYFAGGSNDNRAWQSYRLGPGRSGSLLDFNEANMKIAFNAEYRFNVTGPWNMALFADAGNIWNALDNITDEEMTFNGLKSLKDLALGTGLGVRYDFSFFVIRLDLGFKTWETLICLFYKEKQKFAVSLHYPPVLLSHELSPTSETSLENAFHACLLQ